MNDLMMSSLGFVVKIAREYQHRGMPLEDLINEGNIGLIQASYRFDEERGVKFITYASWWVRKSILRALAEQPMVRVPDYQVRKARLGAPRGTADPVVPRVTTVSLDAPHGEGYACLVDTLIDSNARSAEAALLRREAAANLRCSLACLNNTERLVISYRFELGGDRALTLREVGDLLRLSRERIRQIEISALAKLRAAFHHAGFPIARKGTHRPRAS